MTAWVRLSTPSFWRMADTWALTVASDTLSSYVTGQVVEVNGGQLTP